MTRFKSLCRTLGRICRTSYQWVDTTGRPWTRGNVLSVMFCTSFVGFVCGAIAWQLALNDLEFTRFQSDPKPLESKWQMTPEQYDRLYQEHLERRDRLEEDNPEQPPPD